MKKGEFAVDATAPLAYTSAMPANSQPLSRRRALQFAGIGISASIAWPSANTFLASSPTKVDIQPPG